MVLNFSGKKVDWSFPNDIKQEIWMVGNYVKGEPEKEVGGSINTQPWEGILAKVSDDYKI